MSYDEAFYKAETEIALASANIVLPVIFEWHPEIRTVIDIGCGTGGWANTAADLGMKVRAVDQAIPPHLALLPILDRDLIFGYDCTGFDLAICLEVAEHLLPEAAPYLIEGLSKANIILFSAATPGQPGINHINCRPHDYWHDLFAEYGFMPLHIGPGFTDPVADFYCRNMFLYRKAA